MGGGAIPLELQGKMSRGPNFEFRFRACLNEKVFMMPLFLMCFASFSLAMNFKRDKSSTSKFEFISNQKYAISMKKKVIFWKKL